MRTTWSNSLMSISPNTIIFGQLAILTVFMGYFGVSSLATLLLSGVVINNIVYVFGKAQNGVLLKQSNALERNSSLLRTPEKVQQRFDPHESWLSFIKISETEANKKRQAAKKFPNYQKIKHRGPRGPPGPPGPRGPPGPPGESIAESEMLKNIQNFVQEAFEKRTIEVLSRKCPNCLSTDNTSVSVQDFGELVWLSLTKITSGFYQRLKENEVVSGKTLAELKNFAPSIEEGSFHRGGTTDFQVGRFYAPRGGIYQLSANLNLFLKDNQHHRAGKHKRTPQREMLRILICLQSLCDQNASIDYVASLQGTSLIFTTALSGLLHIQEGQYVSIFVDNTLNKAARILKGSTFTGILLGL